LFFFFAVDFTLDESEMKCEKRENIKAFCWLVLVCRRWDFPTPLSFFIILYINYYKKCHTERVFSIKLFQIKYHSWVARGKAEKLSVRPWDCLQFSVQ
jgi:hypothetical protein